MISYILAAIYVSYLPAAEPRLVRYTPHYSSYSQCAAAKKQIDSQVKAGRIFSVCIKMKNYIGSGE